MEIHQLKTFITVAREGSITRAAELLYLSQPAVSAHIKAIEDTLELMLFTRTAKGMRLTADGQQLLLKAEQTLSAQQQFIDEAVRLKGRLSGHLRLAVSGDASTKAIGQLVTRLAAQYPDIEVTVTYGSSSDVLNGIHNGQLDAGFYNEAGEAPATITIREVASFGICLAAPPGLISAVQPLDWRALEQRPWICPTSSTCCGRAAEALFRRHQIRPPRMISIDHESVTRTLIAGGVGIGLLHAETAREAQRNGEIDIIDNVQTPVRVLFAYLSERAQEPVIKTLNALVLSD